MGIIYIYSNKREIVELIIGLIMNYLLNRLWNTYTTPLTPYDEVESNVFTIFWNPEEREIIGEII